MQHPSTQRMTGKELAELLRVTPSAISRAVLHDTAVRDIAPVAMWADRDPETDRVRGFDVPADDAEMLRQMAFAGQFANTGGAVPRAISPPERAIEPLPAQYPGSLAPLPPAPAAPARSDADIERVMGLLQQQIESRDAENERLRQLLVRTEQEASTTRSAHLRAMDDLRDRMAKSRDEHAEAMAKLREDLAQARLDLRAYEAGAEPLGDEDSSSVWEQLVSEYAPVLMPAAAGLLTSLGARMQGGKAAASGPAASTAPSTPIPVPLESASATIEPSSIAPEPAPAPQETSVQYARPSNSPEAAATLARYLMQSAITARGEAFGPYLDQITPLLSLDDWKATLPPLLADVATRDMAALARLVAPALVERWGDVLTQTPEQALMLATSMGLVSGEQEQDVLHRFATALYAEAERLARGPRTKTPLRPPSDPSAP